MLTLVEVSYHSDKSLIMKTNPPLIEVQQILVPWVREFTPLKQGVNFNYAFYAAMELA
jgi:hypothetical protein